MTVLERDHLIDAVMPFINIPLIVGGGISSYEVTSILKAPEISGVSIDGVSIHFKYRDAHQAIKCKLCSKKE